MVAQDDALHDLVPADPRRPGARPRQAQHLAEHPDGVHEDLAAAYHPAHVVVGDPVLDRGQYTVDGGVGELADGGDAGQRVGAVRHVPGQPGQVGHGADDDQGRHPALGDVGDQPVLAGQGRQVAHDDHGGRTLALTVQQNSSRRNAVPDRARRQGEGDRETGRGVPRSRDGCLPGSSTPLLHTGVVGAAAYATVRSARRPIKAYRSHLAVFTGTWESRVRTRAEGAGPATGGSPRGSGRCG